MPTRLTLDALIVLDAIARRGSFAGAAEDLHRVPSAITYAVHKLEQELALQLFDRSGHRARLTADGEQLLAAGRELLHAADGVDALARRLAGGWEAELALLLGRLLPPESLLPLLAAFYREAPGTRLWLIEERGAGVREGDGRADLVIGTSGPPAPAWATRPFGTVDFVFACAPGHPLATIVEPLPPAVWCTHRQVMVSDGAPAATWRACGAVAFGELLGVPTYPAQLAALRAGLGVGFVPRPWFEAARDAGGLVAKAVTEPPPAVTLHLAWRRGPAGRALQWFLHALEACPLPALRPA
ncbi:LysR family transcriptional regulator [Plasticicumulans lactativorans]|uniref:LysR family transcriptional regulator n=1 Tax=Plasticicumulans lactativorans TaxID=1133106 RepID=A0A4R2LU70_9GAMM|nr:LysR substrate-binding domain-containing protein [Plasticicumulans lactativorans]TCO83423.1 LysR family transcriptional regulator [Plasticicumulans lactativorans]